MTVQRDFSILSFNIAETAQDESPPSNKFEAISTILGNGSIACIQECIRVSNPANSQIIYDSISKVINEGVDEYEVFAHYPLDNRHYPHPDKWKRKDGMIKKWTQEGLWVEQGSAIMVKKPGRICNLLGLDEAGTGNVLTLPWFLGDKPTFFRGGRNSEIRVLLITLVEIDGKFVIVCTLQLSTLSEEADRPELGSRVPTPSASALRARQLGWTARYLESLQDCRSELGLEKVPIVIAGDFNAMIGSEEFRELDALGLSTIVETPGITHRKHLQRIDHVFATNQLITSLDIVDLSEFETDLDNRISDHNPVKASLC
jgi:hypothetical protein